MNSSAARSVFFLAACCVASVAAAAWHEPRPQVVSHFSANSCPVPGKARILTQASTDQDLLLFMFGLAQGMGPQS
jgi:hypothetical protein